MGWFEFELIINPVYHPTWANFGLGLKVKSMLLLKFAWGSLFSFHPLCGGTLTTYFATTTLVLTIFPKFAYYKKGLIATYVGRFY